MTPETLIKKIAAWLKYALLALTVMLAAVAALYGVFKSPHDAQAALYMALITGLAFVLMSMRPSWLRATGAWLGVFLIFQVFTGFGIGRPNYHRYIQPNSVEYLDIRGGLPGVSGLQVMTTDSEGFRSNPRADYTRKVRFRAFAIGGSTTYDSYIDDSRTWTHRLQNKLISSGIDAEVINNGVPGTRALSHYNNLSYVSRFDPDMAIFLMGVNDWNSMIKQAQWPWIPGFSYLKAFRPSQIMLIDAVRVALDLAKRSGNDAERPPRPEDLGRRPDGTLDVPPEHVAPVSLPWADGIQGEVDWSRSMTLAETGNSALDFYRADVERIAGLCGELDIDCVFVTQPYAAQDNADEAYLARVFRDSQISVGDLARVASLYNETLVSVAREHGVHFCDLAGHVVPSFDVFFDTMHFNDNGTETVAAFLHACLMDKVFAGDDAR